MHPRTLATLQQLEKAAWFSRVGVKDTSVAIVLPSWAEAIRRCSSAEWENLEIEAQNQYCERLLKESPGDFARWNDVVNDVRRITTPLVESRIASVVQAHDLPQVFENMVQWDILGVCMEAEFADLVPPGFYAGHCYWYTKGHFPCGWEGSFPGGRPVIY